MENIHKEAFDVEMREGLMNRIGWFTHLRLIFDNSSKDSTSREAVQKTVFLSGLLDSQNNFPLKSVTEYLRQTSEIGLSLPQVFDAVSSFSSSIINFDNVIDIIASLRVHLKLHKEQTRGESRNRREDCSLNVSSIPRTNSFLQKKSVSRDSLFVTHDSGNRGSPGSVVGGRGAGRSAFVSAPGDQELPREESAEFGRAVGAAENDHDHDDDSYAKNGDNTAEAMGQKENDRVLTKGSYQTAPNPESRQTQYPGTNQTDITQFNKERMTMPAARNQCATESEKTAPASSARNLSSGLLIDCSKLAVKKTLNTPLQALQLLPATVSTINIKGMKLDGHELTELTGLPINIVVLNVSNSQLYSLEPIPTLCKNMRLLNVSYNNIQSLANLSEMRNLTELYLGNNNVKSLNECGGVEKLRILDASANPINNFEDIEDLALSKSLLYLQLRDTLLSVQPDYQSRVKEILPTINVVESSEVAKYSAYTKIASFALGISLINDSTAKAPSETCSINGRKPADDTLGQKSVHDDTLGQRSVRDDTLGQRFTHDDTLGQRKSQKKDISNIIENVSSRECTIVSQRNIANSVSKSKEFGNPVAAMMIAPPSGLGGKAKKVIRRMIPASVPSSTKSTFPSAHTQCLDNSDVNRCRGFGQSKKPAEPNSYSAKYRPMSTKAAKMRTTNPNWQTNLFPQSGQVRVQSGRKPSAEPQARTCEKWNVKPRVTLQTPKGGDDKLQPNLRELLKEVYQVIKHKKEEKLSVDTIVVVNTSPHILQQNVTNMKKTEPVCVDLRSERKFFLKERNSNAHGQDTLQICANYMFYTE